MREIWDKYRALPWHEYWYGWIQLGPSWKTKTFHPYPGAPSDITTPPPIPHSINHASLSACRSWSHTSLYPNICLKFKFLLIGCLLCRCKLSKLFLSNISCNLAWRENGRPRGQGGSGQCYRACYFRRPPAASTMRCRPWGAVWADSIKMDSDFSTILSVRMCVIGGRHGVNRIRPAHGQDPVKYFVNEYIGLVFNKYQLAYFHWTFND
jgi:hypothetical protein